MVTTFLPTTITLTLLSLMVVPNPVAARLWAGGVDMNQACKWQHGNDWWARVDPQSVATAWDWQCYRGSSEVRGVDVGAYCRQRYGGNAYADPQGGGAFDWGCYYP